MRLKELRSQRNRVISDLREISNNPAGDGGDLTEDQEKRFNDLKTELESVEKQIDRAAYLEDAERREQGTPLVGQRDSYEQAEREFSMRNVIRSQLQGDTLDIRRELEVSQEIARRSGNNPEGMYVPYSIFQRRVSVREVEHRNLVTSGTGGNLVSTDHRGDMFIGALREQTVVNRAGAMTLTGLRGDIDIPKESTSLTVEWIGEDEATTKSDPTFGKVSMSPKTIAARSEVSRNMVLQSSPQIEELIRSMMAKDIAIDLDRVALRGTGGNEPTGVIGTVGTSSVDMSAGVSWGLILSMIEELETAKEYGGNAFMLSPTLKQALRSTARLPGTDSRFIMDGASSLADYQAYTTSLTDENGSPYDLSIIFGNWSKLTIGIWGDGFDFLINPYESTAFSKGNIQLRAMMSVDVAIRNASSFCVGLNIPEVLDDN